MHLSPTSKLGYLSFNFILGVGVVKYRGGELPPYLPVPTVMLYIHSMSSPVV